MRRSGGRAGLRWAGVLTGLLGSLACGHSSAVQPAAAEPAPPARATAPQQRPPRQRLLLQPLAASRYASLRDVMGDHFAITTWARDAVISGEFESLRTPLRALADYRYEEVEPGGWLPWIAQLQEAARLTSNAQSLEAAASGVATMARVCGECHRTNARGPRIPAVSDPFEHSAQGTLDEGMARHLWASELLWEGLTGPSDETWSGGVKTLREASNALERAVPPSFASELQTFEELTETASAADTLARRADSYGRLIATCAGCHARWYGHGPRYK